MSSCKDVDFKFRIILARNPRAEITTARVESSECTCNTWTCIKLSAKWARLANCICRCVSREEFRVKGSTRVARTQRKSKQTRCPVLFKQEEDAASATGM